MSESYSEAEARQIIRRSVLIEEAAKAQTDEREELLRDLYTLRSNTGGPVLRRIEIVDRALAALSRSDAKHPSHEWKPLEDGPEHEYCVRCEVCTCCSNPQEFPKACKSGGGARRVGKSMSETAEVDRDDLAELIARIEQFAQSEGVMFADGPRGAWLPVDALLDILGERAS